jgi:hypothetical protein
MDEKPKRKRVCHTCAISMDNILVESIRNSDELSFQTLDVLNIQNPVLKRSFDETVRDTAVMSSMLGDN